MLQTPSLSIDKVTVYGVQTGDALTGVIAGHDNSWDYTVTNTGNVSLSNVSVQDDNGTLTNNTDNFVANPVLSGGFNVGDINSDGQLNLGEVWHFNASGIAASGSYSNIGTASGTIGITTVTATDASSYLGIVDSNVPVDCHDDGSYDDHGEQSACGDSSDHDEYDGRGDYALSVPKDAESHIQASNFCTQNESDTIDFSVIRESKADDATSDDSCSTGYGEINFPMGDLLSTGTHDYGHSAMNDGLSADNWSGTESHHIELVGVQTYQSCDFS